ncbi:DUF292-domain-containing protein [Russula vinacea]|nr:DUF292-domain-containing protein [Russula vinacea]
MAPWNSTKAKVPIYSLSVQRLRTLQEKKGAQAKAARRDIATLLERGKAELHVSKWKAVILINEDIHLELLELLELYCELLIARFGLVEQNTREPDPAVSEGICSIIYAAPRTELKVLHVLRDLLMHKYGREFSVAVMENRDNCVSERVMKKIALDMPSADLVEGYLAEIARGYGVQWNTDPRPVGDGQHGRNSPEAAKDVITPLKNEKLAPGEGTPKLPDIPPTEDDGGKEGKEGTVPKPSPEDDFAMLAKRFEALKKR